jgi:MFS family permease
MGALVVFWGAGAVLQAAAFNWSGLMAARFFIGGIEACFGTGVALYLSFFYPRREVGLRFAIYLVGSAIASALAGSIAYGLQQTHTSVASWRLIFIVEAAPTILIGIAIFIWLPDSITTARFLTPQEKKIAEARLYRATIDVQHASDPSNNDSNAVVAFIKSRLDTSNFLSALKDPFSYVSASLLFIINVGYSSVPVYLPTILQGMGYTSLRAQAFSAPPYVGAFVIALLLVYISDRTDIRGCFIVLAAVISAVGYLILAIVEDNSTRYGAVWLVVIGLFSFIPLAYSWLLANTLGESKKGLALVMFGAIGQCGPILGTKLFPATQAPYYRHGMWVSTGVILLGLVITLVTLVVFWRINRRRDAEMNRLYEDEKGSLRYQRKLDLSNSDHRQEMHRRKVDMAEKREASIYFRYSL